MFERVGAKKTEKGVAVFMRAYGTPPTPLEKKILDIDQLGQRVFGCRVAFVSKHTLSSQTMS